jgi:DNA-binding response OmpR family regulator
VGRHWWHANPDPYSNAIGVYINRLRKKVDGGDGVPLIHTRRGAGYLLSPDGTR